MLLVCYHNLASHTKTDQTLTTFYEALPNIDTSILDIKTITPTIAEVVGYKTQRPIEVATPVFVASLSLSLISLCELPV